MANPTVIILAGPNGAGKTTASADLLQGDLEVRQFVNADVIARGLSGFGPERVAMEAGRVMLARLKQLAEERVDFAFETTLASRSFAPWIKELAAGGYEFALLYLWVPDPSLSVARVAHRVASGGHDVPEDVIRRRYRRGLHNFFELYQPLADTWYVYDSSAQGAPRPVAAGTRDEERISDPVTWQRIKEPM
jgi:predicted ABC-type ATPase